MGKKVGMATLTGSDARLLKRIARAYELGVPFVLRPKPGAEVEIHVSKIMYRVRAGRSG